MDLTCPSRTVLSSNTIIPFVNNVNPLNFVGASLPLLFGLLGEERTGVDGFIKQISVGSSYNWYMHLTQFESIFLGVIFLQIIVLRAVGILPIQLNKFVNGDPSGRRRKRRSFSNSDSENFPNTLGCDKDFLGESAFAVIRKLDDQECIQRALCVIQYEAIKGHPIPKSTKELLTALKMSAKRRVKISNLDTPTKPTVTKRCMNFDEANGHSQENVESHKTGSGSAIQIFEDAVMAGREESKLEETQKGHLDPHLSQNSTIISGGGICGRLYKACSLSSDDIIHYFDIIAHAGMV